MADGSGADGGGSGGGRASRSGGGGGGGSAGVRVMPVGDASAADGSSRFDVILLSDLLYECEHEAILRAVVCCLAPLATGGTAPLARASADAAIGARRLPPRVLLTYQVHDRCQQARQAAFFDLAPGFGLAPTKLASVPFPRQFDEADEEEDEEDEDVDEENDVTRQVQLWELVWAEPPAQEEEERVVEDAPLVRLVRSEGSGRSRWRFAT